MVVPPEIGGSIGLLVRPLASAFFLLRVLAWTVRSTLGIWSPFHRIALRLQMNARCENGPGDGWSPDKDSVLAYQ